MIDLQKAFEALPPPASDPRDVEAARHVWLRARIAAIVEDEQRTVRIRRLRMASAFATIVAFDAIVPLLFTAVAAPLIVTVGAIAVTHTAASLALLRS